MATFDLFSAVKDGDTDAVRSLLSSRRCRSHLNDRNEWGDTVLHLAAEAGNSEVCQMLIAGGASVTVRNNRGETCLHRAAVGGHTDCVTAIVERDNDPEAVNSQNDAGYTALHHAAKHGTISLIQVLLRSGSDRMLENNAGETPYMVAHKYQQFEAERLLLNIEQQHADKAIQEMNTKPKKIIAAYSKALKNAHKPESRIRLVFVGDLGSGKTSLKKTLFGESFKETEESTRCISVDPSIARIQFKQYREWIVQPLSKADAHRLNLEYNDAIIDYILNEIKKPGVADEVVDLKKLGLRKQRKNVDFETTPSIIPVLSQSTDAASEEEEAEPQEEEDDDTESDGQLHTPSTSSSSSLSDSNSPENMRKDGVSCAHNRGRQGTIVKPEEEEDEEEEDTEERDGETNAVDRNNTPVPTRQQQQSKLTVFDSTFEMSKDLMEHIPLEVLKRLVMRWPVDGEETTTDQDSVSRRRLLIHIWDCSGDPLQLSVIPLFFSSSRSIYLFSYDARKDLSQLSESFTLRKLTSLTGSPPTNAEVLEEWLGGVIAQSDHSPKALTLDSSSPSPQLPPAIFVTPFSDLPGLKSFHEFFTLPSFRAYKHHMLEPNFISVSSAYESEFSSDYRSHYYLRREIDHLARQMPFIRDMIPVQWVMFEQLLHSLLEQKQIVIQLTDLERYIAERCDIVGQLQVQPVLEYYTDVGLIVHFQRHPALSPLVVIKPQWLMNSLASIFVSSVNNWITAEVRRSFEDLLSYGHIRRDVLGLAYRCSKLPQGRWNEALYFMNYMDLIACHPSLHATTSVYVPALVNQTPPTFAFGPTGEDPVTLFFSCGVSKCPLSLFNQLVVRCIRSCRYPPVLYYGIVHLRLNHTHHLILRREGARVAVLVQRDTVSFCSSCPKEEVGSASVDKDCQHITHFADYERDLTSCAEHLETYRSFLDELPSVSLDVSDGLSSLRDMCHVVLAFLKSTIDFLISCWYPGLVLELVTENGVTIDHKWRETVLKKNKAPEKLGMWFH